MKFADFLTGQSLIIIRKKNCEVIQIQFKGHFSQILCLNRNSWSGIGYYLVLDESQTLNARRLEVNFVNQECHFCSQTA